MTSRQRERFIDKANARVQKAHELLLEAAMIASQLDDSYAEGVLESARAILADLEIESEPKER